MSVKGDGMNKRGFSTPFKILLSALMVFALFVLLDPRPVFSEIQKVSLPLYGIVAALHLAMMAVKSQRWRILLHGYQISCSYRQSLKAYGAGFFFATLSPGQIGDMAKIMLVKNLRKKWKIALVPTVLDRLWDLGGLLITALICGVLMFRSDIHLSLLALPGGLIVTVSALLFRRLYPLSRRYISRRFDIEIIPAQTHWLLPAICTAASLLVQIIRWLILALAMGIAPYPATAIAMIGTLAALLPISVGGLGPREGTMAALFASQGTDPALGVAFSLLMFGCYVFGTVVGALLLLTYDTTAENDGNILNRQER